MRRSLYSAGLSRATIFNFYYRPWARKVSSLSLVANVPAVHAFVFVSVFVSACVCTLWSEL